ncbi:hypothetical protein Nmel_002749 [Mimus melanotis]
MFIHHCLLSKIGTAKNIKIIDYDGRPYYKKELQTKFGGTSIGQDSRTIPGYGSADIRVHRYSSGIAIFLQLSSPRGKAEDRDQQCIVAENPFCRLSEDSDKYLPLLRGEDCSSWRHLGSSIPSFVTHTSLEVLLKYPPKYAKRHQVLQMRLICSHTNHLLPASHSPRARSVRKVALQGRAPGHRGTGLGVK